MNDSSVLVSQRVDQELADKTTLGTSRGSACMENVDAKDFSVPEFTRAAKVKHSEGGSGNVMID
jgi:hypothetical protein